MPRWCLAIHLLAVDAFVPADVLYGAHVRPRGSTVNLPGLAPRRPHVIPATARTAADNDDSPAAGDNDDAAAVKEYLDQMTAPIPHLVKSFTDAMTTPPLGEFRQALDVLSDWAKAADDDEGGGPAADKVYFDQMAGPVPDMVGRLADAMPAPEPGPFRGVRASDVLSKWSSDMEALPAVESETQKNIDMATRRNIDAVQRALSAGEASHVYALTAKIEPDRTAASYREESKDYAIRHILAIGVARYACVGGSLCGLDITQIVVRPSADHPERANYMGELLQIISSWTAQSHCAVMIEPPSRRDDGFYERWGFFPMGGKFEGVHLGVAEPYRETEHSLVELVAGGPVAV